MSALNEEKYDTLYAIARDHLTKGNRAADLEEELLKYCTDIVTITVVIKEARTHYHDEMQKDGIQKLIIGAVLGFLGFLMTILHFGSGTSFEYALFGFTTIGITMVFWGLYKIIG